MQINQSSNLELYFYICIFKEEAYSYESSIELLEKDVVQLHAPRWQSMRKVCTISFVVRHPLRKK